MNTLKQWLNLNNKDRTLYGLGYLEISTGFADRNYIDYLIYLQKKEGISQIVELGTWKGVTSLHLGITSKVNGIKFHTFDIEDFRIDCIKKSWLDNMNFYQEDVLQLNERVVEIISKPNTLIFIDNGDKEKEFNMYVPYVGKNSTVIIHDWETEVDYENIKKVALEHLIPLEWDLAETLETHCRAWRKE